MVTGKGEWYSTMCTAVRVASALSLSSFWRSACDGEKRVNFLSHFPAGRGQGRSFSGSHGSWSLHSNHSPAMLDLKFSWNGMFGKERTLRMNYIKGGAPDGTDMWEGSLGVEVWNTVSIYGDMELQMHEVRMWLRPNSDVSMPGVPDPPPALEAPQASPPLALEDLAAVPSCDDHAKDKSWEVVNDINNRENTEEVIYWM